MYVVKIKGFAQKFNVDILIYFEKFDLVILAIAGERQIKGYSRSKKLEINEHFMLDGKNYTMAGKLRFPRLSQKQIIQTQTCKRQIS
jgi:predicted GIY-YIG superfamily endonuclease